MSIIGVAEHYAQVVKLFRLRIEELGITYETVDALCGFPARYTATLLCEAKAMSVYSFFTMARGLALLPTFQHDPEQLADLSQREDWIEIRRRGPRYRPASGVIKFTNHRDFYKQIGRKGARAMHAKRIQKRRRIEAARTAAQIRWARAANE